VNNNYVRRKLMNKIIDIKNGRHPVIEKKLPVGEEYIANDVYLDNDTQQIIMITGPICPVNQPAASNSADSADGPDRKFCTCRFSKYRTG